MAKNRDVLAAITDAAARGFPFYVYTLADAQGVFYVGKGKGARLLTHGRVASDHNAQKMIRIAAAGVDQVCREVVAFFKDAGAAFGLERQLIAEKAGNLTNATGGCADPYESEKARARAMLARVVPFDQCAMRRIPRGRDIYDALVAALQQEAENPTPSSITFFPGGKSVFAYGETHGARR